MLEVIGAGFGRTGTLSLKLALEMLGFGPCYHMVEVFKSPDHLQAWDALGQGQEMDWETLFQEYRATVDWPAATYYAELMAVYPQAKVLLSVREPASWYKSAFDTIYSTGKEPNPESAFNRMVDNIIWQGTFGGKFADQEAAMAVFEAHNAAVKQTVPSDRLLVYSVKEGWEPLCRFLGVAIPEAPFPRVNDTASFLKRLD